MGIVLLTHLFYLLDQSVSNIFIQVLDVEILILLIKIKEQLLLILDLLIDSQKCGDLVRQNMYQVLLGQVL